MRIVVKGLFLIIGLMLANVGAWAGANPPQSLSASYKTYEDRIIVEWETPFPDGDPVSEYRIYRYPCSQSHIRCFSGDESHPTDEVQRQSSSLPRSWADTGSTGVVPGIAYCYSMNSVSFITGFTGDCSVLVEGLANYTPTAVPPGVRASDGLQGKIKVEWTPSEVSPIFGDFQIRRSLVSTPSDDLRATLYKTVGLYDDLTTGVSEPVVPGRLYYYWLRGFVYTTDGRIPVDGVRNVGYASITPPTPNGSQGEHTDRVIVRWSKPYGDVSGYKLYRDTIVSRCGTELVSGLSGSAVTFEDTINLASPIIPGVRYYYSLKVQSESGLSDCGQIGDGFARIGKPINVDASDGKYLDKVEVKWTAPQGSVSSYTLYRDIKGINNTPCSRHLKSNILTTSYNDDSAVPGTLYDYSVKTISPTGESQCSNIDPGYAKINPPRSVSATDGDFPNKVVVTWLPPSPTGQITGFAIYRDTTCSLDALVKGDIGANATSYDDFSVTPGVSYPYSLRTLSSTGESICSTPDTGFARIGPPTSVSATDGTYPDKVVVNWVKPGGDQPVSGFNLYRDTNPTACASLLVGGLAASATAYNDTSASPGVIYHYSLLTLSPTRESICSNVDSGFAKAPVHICSNGIDDDNDGLTDLQDPGCENDPTKDSEKNPNGSICDNGLDDDGDRKIDFRLDGMGDAGCNSPVDQSEDDVNATLKSPAYVKFNTYLGQLNFAELINDGTKEKSVDVSLFNLHGQEMITRSFLVPANSEVDVDINSMLKFACDVLNSNCSEFEDLSATRGYSNGQSGPDGIVDTYGLVMLKFVDSDPNERILGRISFYRTNPDGKTYSFAFAREFRNPSKGATYSTANTYDPQGMGYLVPNWAEVVNFEPLPQGYTMNIYTQTGELKKTNRFTLPSLGEFDFQAGHEFLDAQGKALQSVYLVEVIPDNPEAEYFLSVSRYSSNSPINTDPETYNFAFNLDGFSGSTESIFAPISNRLVGVQGVRNTVSVLNWAEVANVGNTTAGVMLIFRDQSGKVVESHWEWIRPKAQFHYQASALLPANSSGVLEVYSDVPVVVQSMTYVHGEGNKLQTGFASSARPKGRAVQAGTINTFLQMQNILDVLSTDASGTDVNFNIKAFTGAAVSGSIALEQNGSSVLQISNNPSLNFPADTYGALKLDGIDPGHAIGEVRRVRVVNGAVDFVMPTRVQ